MSNGTATRLLIIGSLSAELGQAARMAQAGGAKLVVAEGVSAGLSRLRGEGADLVLCDVAYDIAWLVERLAHERIVCPIIACGRDADADSAVRAIQAGAKEFLTLPPDPALIVALLQAVTAENTALIHRDPSMNTLLARAAQLAPAEASILIGGESGTGKEVLARYIHMQSRRGNGPFVALNCAALPETLLESELFGHEKGAFSGAVAARKGKFEQADGGTLLLDEIGEMDPRLQAKLLRAIQEREIDRLGGTSPIKVNVRILAATHRDLMQEVHAGRFRADLYFRLNVVALHIPPLRARPLDIIALAEHFSERFAAANDVPKLPFSTAAEAALLAHGWPGNVRELENAVHRAVLLAGGDEIVPEAIELGVPQAGSNAPSPTENLEETIGTAADLHAVAHHTPRQPAPSLPSSSPALPSAASGSVSALVGRRMEEVEQALILETLSHCLGNRTRAAEILGISIRTLRNKLQEYRAQGSAVPPAPGQLTAEHLPSLLANGIG